MTWRVESHSDRPAIPGIHPLFTSPLRVWALSVAIAATFACCNLHQAPAADWPYPRGDAKSSGASKFQLPDQLTVGWEFKADDAIEATPVVAGGQVYVADAMGTIYALSRKTGNEVWRTTYDTIFLAAPIVDQGTVIIGDIDGNVYSLSSDDGKERWKATLGGEISGSAAVYQDKILIASQDAKLYCLSRADGDVVWTYEADDQIRCAPTIAGDRTFLGGCDAKLHIVDLTSGKAAGKPLPLGGPTGSTPAIQGNVAIVPAMDGSVFAFDWKSSKQLWRYEDPAQSQEYENSAAFSDKVTVVSSQRRHIDAINVETGKRIWRQTIKRRADASPVIAGNDVWLPATDGRLYRLSLTDGKQKWSYEIRGGFVGSVAVTDKELFVADDEGVVRCFR